MNWAIAGLVYAGAYAALMTALADRERARMMTGNIALLLPPLAPLYVLVWRRGAWRGRQAVFWGAIGAWAALWFVGQIGWASDELFRATPLPWFKWHIVLQLCGSALPLIALVAWPHRAAAAETAITMAIDIAVLVFLTGFLYWSLIIAPANGPGARRVRAAIAGDRRAAGEAFRRSSVCCWRRGPRATAPGPTVYRRLALGMVAGVRVLIGMSVVDSPRRLRTGSPADIGWMLPFFFAAWAAATAPASPAARRAARVVEWRRRRRCCCSSR